MRVVRKVSCCGFEYTVEITYQRPFVCSSCGKEFTVKSTSTYGRAVASMEVVNKDDNKLDG